MNFMGVLVKSNIYLYVHALDIKHIESIPNNSSQFLFYIQALNVMMDVEGRPRVHHPMSSYIDYGKDKQGMTQSILRIPHWVKTDPLPPIPNIEFIPPGLSATPNKEYIPPGPAWSDRGMADGGSPDYSPHLTATVGVKGI